MMLLLGLALSTGMGMLGYWRRSLSWSGVVGAVVVGTTIFGLGGWGWGTLLVVFFLSSSALSHFKEARKAALAEKFSKGGRRDLAQALANGGVGALAVVGNALWPHPLWWVGFAGAFATVNADTWATELGVLSKAAPRLITSGRVVETGTSGGVTALGTLAALAGAGLIGLVAAGFDLADGETLARAGSLVLAAAAGGVGGSLVDSLLGATAQAIYVCEGCGQETERHPRHRCGAATRRVRGWRWLDNDWVNFLSSAAGGLAAVGLWAVMA